MNDFIAQNWKLILIICFALLLVAYLIAAVTSSGSFIKTKWAGTGGIINADHLYYLPTANLLLKATAKVVVEKDAAGTIQKATLAELALEPTVQVVPDTTNAFSVHYSSSPFAKDEVDISINAAGLLEGVNLSAEDRIAEIISQTAEAPKVILTSGEAAAGASLSSETTNSVTIEIKEYTNSFIILSSEIGSGPVDRLWTINVDGDIAKQATTVTASFTLKFMPQAPTALVFDTTTEYAGLATRPLHSVQMEVYKQGQPTRDAVYSLALPDKASLMVVPVKRTAFVAKTYGIKMTNGLLSGNKINKPSEVEGFISIPIKIGRALVSVPARLFQFTIDKMNRQTTYETAQTNLLKAQLLARKEQTGAEAQLTQAKLDAQKVMLGYEAEIAKTKLGAEKGLVAAQTELLAAKQALDEARKKLEEQMKKGSS